MDFDSTADRPAPVASAAEGGSRDGRRRFLAGVVTAIQAAIGGTLAGLAGGAVVAPSFARRQGQWVAAGLLSDLPDDQPTPVTLRLERDDGPRQIVDRHVVFLVRTAEAEVRALSSTCSHLGCRVSWDPSSLDLRCPCHGGGFDRTGAVTAGPPPAPLATHATRVDGDQVLVWL